MHNIRFAPQTITEGTSVERKAPLPLTVCLCVIHQRLTGQDEKIPQIYYVNVVCLTRFHSDLCTAHFLILFHFLAFPQEGHLVFVLFLLEYGAGGHSWPVAGLKQQGWVIWMRCMLRAIVPFQRTVSKIAQLSTLPCPLRTPPEPPSLHRPPHH